MKKISYEYLYSKIEDLYCRLDTVCISLSGLKNTLREISGLLKIEYDAKYNKKAKSEN